MGHEGDWEGISVRLDDRNLPLEVAYYAHGPPQILDWGDVPKLGLHPIVYSALGSHASYPRTGRNLGNADVVASGVFWPTWNLVADARTQAWYGFGGDWGVAKAWLEGTGPLGPSTHKRPAPCGWIEDCP